MEKLEGPTVPVRTHSETSHLISFTTRSMCYSLRNKRKRRKNAISRKVKVRRTIPGSAPTDDGIYSGPTPVLHPSYVKICSVVLCNPAHKPTAKLKDTSENTKPPWRSLYNITSVCCTRKKMGHDE